MNRQFRTGATDFAVDTMNQNYGRHDFVSGTFFLTRDHDRDNPYQFTCRVNDFNGHVRMVSIGPSSSAYIPPAPAYTGSANRMMDMARVDVDNCQGAVDQNLHDRGYTDITVNSINQQTGLGGTDFISGSASAYNGYDTDTFGFTCRMNLDTGNVRSVDVFHR